MVNGDYEEALKEFALANSYFVSGGCHEENATALDNIGRVYAQLGHSSLAMLLIERGRTQRERLRLNSSGNYRYALSLHSSAVAHIGFGHPFRAAVLCKEAFDIFQSLQAKHGFRGVGLVLLTWGTTERYLSAFWKNRDHDRAERHLESAESYLLRAARIFGATDTLEPTGSTHPETRDAQIDKTVDEPIRLVQAYDELGCVYRDRVVLSGSPDITQFAIARQMFHRAKEVAKKHGYGVLSADACEDLAKTYFRAGEYNEANRWLDEAEGDIPQSCRLSRDAMFRGCSEDFWQQLGKIHLLRGTIGMTSLLRTRSGNESAQEQLIRGVVEHYVFAVAYFDRFLTRPLDSGNGWLYPDLRPRLAHHALFTEEILEELSHLKPDDLSLITQKILPSLYHDHEIPVKVQSFFTRGIEFLQHMSATSKPEGE
jgi:tetratricopeptide (TPR) repeat protein